MASVFISHSSKDEDEAIRLKRWLQSRGFDGVFLDFDTEAGIAPGADWERTIYREIDRAAAVLLVLTPNWLASKWCFAEFAQARALGKAIYPLIESPDGDLIISPDIQHLDLVRDRDGGLDRLARDLTEVVVNLQGGFYWDITRSPFPGLAAMEEADAAVYFGRDDDIRRLIERLNARRIQGGEKIVALLGASGSGKSSLIRAGVLPRLARDKRNWIVVPPFRPQLRPVDELAQALGSISDEGWRIWRERLLGDEVPNHLADLARDLRERKGANEARILISIDQGEELFGVADATQAHRFLDLIRIIMTSELPYLVLIGLRSDYLSQWQAAEALRDTRFEQFSLKPVPVERVRQIIEGPARVAGLTVDEGLMLAATKDAAVDDALPLLAFALRELADKHTPDKRLTLNDYLALGDAELGLSPLENAVKQRADATLHAAHAGDDDLAALKDALVPAAVRVNAEGDYVRQPASVDEMPPRALPLIERLAQARLLTLSATGDQRQVEVVHEALLRKWPLLRGWLDAEQDFIIGREQLKRDVADWRKTPAVARATALLTGLKLARALSWLAAHPRHLTKEEREYIQESRAAAESEAQRREAEREERDRLRSRLLRGAVSSTLIAAVIAGLAGWQWWRADQFAQGEAAQSVIAEQQKKDAQDQRALAQARQKEAESEQQVAESNFEAARETVRGLVLDLGQGLEDVSGMRAETIRNILETSEKTIDMLIARAPEDVKLLDTQAAMFSIFSRVYLKVADPESAMAAAQRGADIQRKIVSLTPRDALAIQHLATALSAVVVSMENAGHLDDGIRLASEALDIVDHFQSERGSMLLRADNQKSSPNGRDQSEPDNIDHVLGPTSAVLLLTIGEMKLEKGHVEAAELDLNRSRSIINQLMDDSTDFHLIELNAQVLVKLADIKAATDQNAAAENYNLAILSLRQLIAQHLDDLELSRDLAQSLRSKSAWRYRSNDLPGALQAKEESLPYYQKLMLADAKNEQARSDYVSSLETVGDERITTGDISGGFAAYDDAIGILRRQVAASPDEPKPLDALAAALKELGDEKQKINNADGAFSAYEESLIYEQRALLIVPEDIQYETNLYHLYEAIGDLANTTNAQDRSIKNYRDGAATARKVMKTDSHEQPARTDLVEILLRLGDVMARPGDWAAAIKLYHEASETSKAALGTQGENLMQLATALQREGDMRRKLGDNSGAIVLLKESSSHLRKLLLTDPTNDGATHSLSIVLERIGDADAEAGGADEARTAFDESIDLARQRSSRLGETADAMLGIFDVVKAAGDGELQSGHIAEAINFYSNAVDLARELTKGPDGAKQKDVLVSVLGSFAFAKLENKEFSEALSMSDEAISIDPSQLWLFTNRAHALMFLGRSDDARKLYLGHLGETMESSGGTWQSTILADFALFHRLNIDNPLMKSISTELINYGRPQDLK